ncbi:mycothiol synthase [Sediminihabitans luteus]|uniref:Mycothiol acetyltransferase n=1 Tax=Sediminihabitans luteus TaxID=1138585 RepID=A0A2M9D0D0_9CELL|nr:mycothiol synthase [Sediminihabitans luteus]PJJ77563.1 mycothiol synthase [Sediminihabitans luteus]GII98462.1 mycothiol acetyltransferase [Sediminihabitans luteus]
MPLALDIGPLDAPTAAQVRALADAAERADGVAPLSEQPLLRLGTDSELLTHVVVRSAGQVVGYAQVDRGGDDASAEIVVHPEHRRRGTGRTLLRTAVRDARLPAYSGTPGQHGKALHVWAHGDLPPAQGLAAAEGLVVVRELLRLGLDLAPDRPRPQVPPGYVVRPFVPGADDAAWLALNARAFAHHPEQGRTTLDDLRARQHEDWFDASGFWLLERADGTLAGFHWTKVPAGQTPAPDGRVPEGEVYVVGVDPDAQGQGLGAVLTEVGLAHLARTCVRAVLYVDGDNTAAVRTYERAGFARDAVDVQYGPATTTGGSDTHSSSTGATMGL